MKNMKIQRIITWRLPELCSYPQEMMFWLYLFISLLHHNLSPSLSFFLPPILLPSTYLPPSNPQPPSCQDVASFGLRLNGGIWHRSPLLACFFFLFLFFFLISKSTHVYAPNLCTLWFSTSRRELNPGLMCTGSPPLALREKGRRWGGRGMTRENRKRESMRSEEEMIFWFSTQALWSWKAVYMCVFLSPLVRTRGEEIVLSTAWGLCWAYIFKPPLFRA